MIYFARLFDIDYFEVSTASIYLVSVVGFNILWFITKPLNKYHRMIFLICILGVLFGSRLLGQVFDMHDISSKALALCLVFAYAEMSVITDLSFILKQIDNKVQFEFKEKLKQKFLNA